MNRSHCRARIYWYLFVGRIITLFDVHILISRTCDYVTLHNKRDIANVIKLKILKWGDYLGLSGRAQCNHRDRRESHRKKCDNQSKVGCNVRRTQLGIAGFEDRERWGMSPGMQVASGKGGGGEGNGFSLSAFRWNTDLLIF